MGIGSHFNNKTRRAHKPDKGAGAAAPFQSSAQSSIQPSSAKPVHGRPAVVIDTNVLLDAMAGWIGIDAAPMQKRALELLEKTFTHYRVCMTRPTMQEFCYIALGLHKQATNIPPSDGMRRVDFIKYLEARVEFVEPQLSSLNCCDPADQMFLEAAQGARARYIVSRDSDILRLKREGKRLFLHPYDYLESLHKEEAELLRRAAGSKKFHKQAGANTGAGASKPSANFKQYGSQPKRPKTNAAQNTAKPLAKPAKIA